MLSPFQVSDVPTPEHTHLTKYAMKAEVRTRASVACAPGGRRPLGLPV